MRAILSHRTLFKKAAISGIVITLASMALFIAFSTAVSDGPDDYWIKESIGYFALLNHDVRHYVINSVEETTVALEKMVDEGTEKSAALYVASKSLMANEKDRPCVWLWSDAGDVISGVTGENVPFPEEIDRSTVTDSNFINLVYQNQYYLMSMKPLGRPGNAQGKNWILAVAFKAETVYRYLDRDNRVAGIRLSDGTNEKEKIDRQKVTSIPLYTSYGARVGDVYISTALESFADKFLWGWQIDLLSIMPVLTVIIFLYLLYRYFSTFSDHSAMLGRLLKSDRPGAEIFRRDQHMMEKYMPELAELFNLAGESAAEKMYFKKSFEQIEMILEVIEDKGFENKSISDVLEFMLRGLPECGGLVLSSIQSSESSIVLGRHNISDDLIHVLANTPKGQNFLKIAAKQLSRFNPKSMQGLPADNDLTEIFARYQCVNVFPLRLKGRLIGIMLLVSNESESKTHFFSGISDLLVEIMAVLAFGMLLERERHLRADGSRILQETSLAISSTLDLPSVLRIVAHRLTDYTEAAYCLILLKAMGSDEAEVASFFIRKREEIPAPSLDKVNLADFAGLAKAILANRATVLDKRDIADLSEQEKLFFNAESIESLTVLPIAHSAKFIGSIVLGEERPGARGVDGSEKLTIIQAIASQAASAIENARLYGFIKQKVDQLTASYNVSAIINSEIDIDKMLSRVLEATKEYLNFSYTIIYSVDNDKRILEPMAYRGFRPDTSSNGIIAGRGGTITGLVASTGEAVITDDTRLDSNLRSSYPNALSELAVPIKVAERVVGVFSVGSEAKNAFSSLDEEFLQSLASQIALAMEKAQLFEQEKERGKRLKTIYEFSRQTSKTLNIDEVLEVGVESIREAFGCHLVLIMLKESGSEYFYLARQSSDETLNFAEADFEIYDKSLLKRTINSGRTLYCVDSASDPGYVPSSPNLRSELCVPIIAAERIIGVLELGSTVPNNFSNEDINTFEALSDILAVAIEKSFLFRETNEKAERLSLIDKINMAISTALDLDSFFNVVAKAVSDNAGYKWTLLVVPDGDSFSCKAVYSPKSLGELYPVPLLEILHNRLKQVFSTKRAEFVSFSELASSARPEQLQPAVDAGIRHLVLLPIGESEKCEAVLTVGSSCKDGFTAQELSLLNDITVHLQIAWQNARLYEQLKTAYRQLQEAQDQVVQTEKLRALGEMSSGVVHDFNNILAAILGRVQLMIKKMTDMTDEKWFKFFEKNLTVIETAVKDGSSILSRISEFTKKRPSEKFIPLNIGQIISDAIELTKPRWRSQALSAGKKIDIKLERSGSLQATGSPTELREVFTNLINNAVDAVEKNGVIEICAAVDHGNRIVVTIEDNGRGMTEETRKKIFEPFFTTKGKSGTGLGLSVTYGIINRHNGSIEVESQVGVGTKFKIVLPVGIEPEIDRRQETAAETKSSPGRILVVDDEESLTEILSEILVSAGHEVDTASGGSEAIRLLSAKKYDLVITDLGMEDISGWGLADEIYNKYPETRVIIATGWGAQVEPGNLSLHHANGLISKPFRISEITGIVDEVMSRPREEVLVDKV